MWLFIFKARIAIFTLIEVVDVIRFIAVSFDRLTCWINWLTLFFTISKVTITKSISSFLIVITYLSETMLIAISILLLLVLILCRCKSCKRLLWQDCLCRTPWRNCIKVLIIDHFFWRLVRRCHECIISLTFVRSIIYVYLSSSHVHDLSRLR